MGRNFIKMQGDKTYLLVDKILTKLNVLKSESNIEYLVGELSKFRGAKKLTKIVSFNKNGKQVNLFNSIFHCAKHEGVKYKTLVQCIDKKTILRKTGLRYCRLSDFGNFKCLTA